MQLTKRIKKEQSLLLNLSGDLICICDVISQKVLTRGPNLGIAQSWMFSFWNCELRKINNLPNPFLYTLPSLEYFVTLTKRRLIQPFLQGRSKSGKESFNALMWLVSLATITPSWEDSEISGQGTTEWRLLYLPVICVSIADHFSFACFSKGITVLTDTRTL